MSISKTRSSNGQVISIRGRSSDEALIELILAVRCGELGDLIFMGVKIDGDTLVAVASYNNTEVHIHPVGVGSEGSDVVDTATMIKVLGLGDNRSHTLLKLRAVETGGTFRQGLD